MKRSFSFFIIFILVLILSLTACHKAEPTLPLSPKELAGTQTRLALELASTQPGSGIQGDPGELLAIITPSTGGTQTESNLFPNTTQGIVIYGATPTLPGSNGMVKTPTRTRAPSNPGTTATVKTPTLTATQPTGWAGQWTVYYGNEGNLVTGTMEVTVSGTTLSATATISGSSMTFTGNILENGQKVQGTFTKQSSSGWFYWELTSTNQFGGNLDNEVAFCASRQGITKPDRCGIFFPR